MNHRRALSSHLIALACSGALAAQAGPTEVVQGTLVDRDGKPAAGATVELHRRPGRGFNCLDLPFARSSERRHVLRTGKNGTFAGELPRGVPFDVVVDDGVSAPIRRCAVYGGEELRLELVPAAQLTVLLKDAAGKPSPGGTLEAWDESQHRWVDGAFDANGRWQSGRLPPGKLTFDIAPASARRPEWRTVELAAGASETIEFTLAEGAVLRGRVTDEAGQPIAGARVGEGWTMDKFVRTGADGRYEMLGYGDPGYGSVRVTADGYVARLRRCKPAQELPALDFVLPRGGELTGRVLDAKGKPLAGVYVAAVGGSFGSSRDDTHDWVGVRTDAEGRYRIGGVRLDVPHAILLTADGHATLVGDRPAFPADGKLVLPDVTMRPPRYVGGVVVDGDGAPVVGITVTLRGVNADRATLFGGGAAAVAANYCIAQREMRTDSRGRLHFADVPPGSYAINLEWPGGESAPVAVEVGDTDPEPVRLVR